MYWNRIDSCSAIPPFQIRVLSAWLISCRENQEVVNMALLSVQDLQAEVERQRAATAELAGGHAEVASRREALQEMDQNVHLVRKLLFLNVDDQSSCPLLICVIIKANLDCRPSGRRSAVTRSFNISENRFLVEVQILLRP